MTGTMGGSVGVCVVRQGRRQTLDEVVDIQFGGG